MKNNRLIIISVIILFFIGFAVIIFRINDDNGLASQNQNIINPTTNSLQNQTNNTTLGESVEVKEFKISGQNYSFSQDEIKVKKGDLVRIIFTSEQGFHDWVVDQFDIRTDQISAGQTTKVEFIADKTGTFEYYCSVGNHRQLGMIGNLIVEEN